MAPGFAGLLDPLQNASLVDGRARAGSNSSEGLYPDEMAMLEETFEGSHIEAGEEVEIFAKYLDDSLMSGGSAAEQREKIFDLVDKYYVYTEDCASALRKRQNLAKAARGGSWQIAHSDDNSGHDSNDMDLDEIRDPSPKAAEPEELLKWEEEAQTWDLLRHLLPLRYRDRTVAQQPKWAEQIPRSRREYWADFLHSEPKAQERKVILGWLQRNASNGPSIDEVVKDLQRNADRGEILAHGWLHTRGAIKQHKRLVASSDPLEPRADDLAGSNLETVNSVTQLDPDVVKRQNPRKLATQDDFFEKSIWRGCFELLRRGSSTKAIRDWCQERTELWRAASFSALPLSDEDDEELLDFDPFPTVLWRRMCFKLAQDADVDEYERAVYGILSGDVSSVDHVCKTWDDLTFVKYNTELRAQFDAYLKKQCDDDALRSLTLLHGDVITSSDSREREERTRKTLQTPIKALHAAIIENRLDGFFFQQGLVLAAQANARRPSKLMPIRYEDYSPKPDDKYIDLVNHNALRLLAHVQIIISALDRLDGNDVSGAGLLAPRHEVQENVIAGYTSILRLCHLEPLIPLYASTLVGDRRYENLSWNLIHIESRETQLRLLSYVQKLGLDVIKFVKSQPQIYLNEVRTNRGVRLSVSKSKFSVLQPGPPILKYGRLIEQGIFGGDPESDDPEDPDEVVLSDKRDELLIRSMEWLLLVDGMVLETCGFAIKIYRYFLKYKHLAAARLLTARVPCSEIIRLKMSQPMSNQEMTDPSWWDEVFSSGAENSDRMDEDSFENIGVSREDLAGYARPLWELECLVNAIDCLETTALTAENHKQNPTADREVAKIIDDNAKLMKGFMKPLLKDWLLSTVEEDKDFIELREGYLPEMIIAYASTLQFAGTTTSRDYLLECMDLASVIAEKGSDLADVFVKAGRMKELLESFTSCSKALAIWTTDLKKGPGASSKKLREMGWSRELWSVKP